LAAGVILTGLPGMMGVCSSNASADVSSAFKEKSKGDVSRHDTAKTNHF